MLGVMLRVVWSSSDSATLVSNCPAQLDSMRQRLFRQLLKCRPPVHGEEKKKEEKKNDHLDLNTH